MTGRTACEDGRTRGQAGKGSDTVTLPWRARDSRGICVVSSVGRSDVLMWMVLRLG